MWYWCCYKRSYNKGITNENHSLPRRARELVHPPKLKIHFSPLFGPSHPVPPPWYYTRSHISRLTSRGSRWILGAYPNFGVERYHLLCEQMTRSSFAGKSRFRSPIALFAFKSSLWAASWRKEKKGRSSREIRSFHNKIIRKWCRIKRKKKEK